MTPENFASWSGQIAVLIAAAALASVALRSTPRARLIFWHAVLALALILPLVQPWPAPHDDSSGVTISTGAATIPANAPSGFHLTWRVEYFLWIAALGAIARLIWIGFGLFRLRRHRLAATRLENPPVPFAGVHWYLSETVSGPVTFGFFHPAILLPARFPSMPAEIQRAIACHELIHVRRRDWLFVIAEEIVRAAFWFHPAVWFALSRIQLAREQAVDLEAIALTRDRDRYLDALVAVAEQKFRPDLAPAPLFLTKRHLASRVAAILKETRMSKARIAAAVSAVSSAALLAARLAIVFFPLHSQAQMIPDSPGVTVDAGAPLMHRAPVRRPFGVTTTGTVTVEATLNSKGEVADAHVLSGPDELRRAALQSILEWHYSNDPAPPSPVRATIQFGPPPTNVPAPPSGALSARITLDPAAGGSNNDGPPQAPATIRSIRFLGTPSDLEQKVRAALPVHEGDQVTQDTVRQALAAARAIDEHFTGSLNIDASNQAALRLVLSGATDSGAPVALSAPNAASAPQRIKVGGNVMQANLLIKVNPSYPPDAKAAHIQGIVRMTVTIGKDGTVQNIDLVSGDATLAQSAMDAVKQWVYKPTLLNGNPVEVITTVDVNYTLSN